MTIVYNRERHVIADASNRGLDTVADLLRHLLINPVTVAVVCNGNTITRRKFATHRLEDDDAVVIVRAFAGG